MESRSYYRILEEDIKVLNYVKSFENDFLVHDKNALKEDNEKTWFYAIRESGTNLFCISNLLNAVKNRNQSYFTPGGWKHIRDKIRFDPDDFIDICAMKRHHNDRFFVFKQGKIKEISEERIQNSIQYWFNEINRFIIG